MKRFATILAAAMLTGCGTADVEDFRAASPSRQGIDIKTPSSSSQALTASDLGQAQQALGQLAPWYVATRATSSTVNSATVFVLNLCEEIVSHEPSTLTGNQAVWGPHTGPLSLNTFKFTVTKKSDGSYDYALEGKRKTAADSEYSVLLSGQHVPSGTRHVGKGTFTVSWNAIHALDPQQTNTGSADFSYERNAHGDVAVGASFLESSGKTAVYEFSQVAGGDGSFEFATSVDWRELPANTSALERFSIKSRWTNDGPGRADLKASGGDLAQDVTLSECWDADFLRVYYADSLGFTQTEGSEAACAFAPASYTDL
jgi:hypothetical protein